MKVVLTRAGGPLADRLVPALLAAGHDVRVPAPPDGAVDRRARPVGVRPDDGSGCDAVIAVDPDPTAIQSTVPATSHLVVVATHDAAAVESALVAIETPWTLQATTVLHDEVDHRFRVGLRAASLAVPRDAEIQPVDPAEVAERIVCLLRAGPAGRVPDFGGPSVETVTELATAWLSRTGRAHELVAGEAWPEAWSTRGRAVGKVGFLEWLDHRSGHGRREPFEGRHQAVGGERASDVEGAVQEV